jgi:3-mercaptopyruvate sulfurtransferase SseA
MDRLAYISRDQNIIVGCPGGVRSTRVANLLMQNGYGSVASLDGGLNTWKAKGFPIKYNTQTGCCSSSDRQLSNSVLLTGNNLKNEDHILDYKDLKRC